MQLLFLSIMMNHLLLFTLLLISGLSQLSSFSIPCRFCHEVVSEFQKSIPPKPTESLLEIISNKYCIKKKIQNPNVCKGAVSQMVDSIVNSVWKHYTDPHSLCHKVRMCPKQYILRNLTSDINSILKNKPQKEWQTPTKRKLLKVMHISDVHADLYYTSGAPSACSEPVCCRSNVTLKLSNHEAFRKVTNKEYLEVEQNGNGSAGYWGSLSNCDLPFQTFDLFTNELSKINIDLVLWTGDNTPHDVWQQTQSYNLNYTFIETEKLKNKTKSRVIAAMGNHESFPVNVYDYQGEREQMLIGGLAEAWKQWLDDKAYQMLKTKGFFSITIPQMNNLKIISINTQAQNDMNWYLMRDPTDPGQMLVWIQQELKESEKNNQYVWIIGHISPKSALNEWSMRFNALTERFSYTIRGQFYGHSHTDHIGFFPSIYNNSKITNYFFIAPSLTTYSNKYPEYRIMTIDYDTLQVVDYDQYRLDISKFTKKQQDAKFQKFYSFKESYQLSDLTINGGMTQLREKLKNDKDTQILYTHLRSSGTEKGYSGAEVACDNVSSPQYYAECKNKTMKATYFDKVAGRWKDLNHK